MYLYKLLFLWCPLIKKNSSVWGAHQGHFFFAWKWTRSWLPKHHATLQKKKKPMLDRSQKRRSCQLISVMPCFLFWVFWPLRLGPTGFHETSERNYHPTLHSVLEEQRSHMTICYLTWCGFTRYSSLWSGLALSGSRFLCEWKLTSTYLTAKFKVKNLVLYSSKYSMGLPNFRFCFATGHPVHHLLNCLQVILYNFLLPFITSHYSNFSLFYLLIILPSHCSTFSLF